MLETFEVETSPSPRASVIWMHGLGATNHDFDDVVPMLRLPDVRFVFPQAPELAVTINGGMRMPAWYDILTFDEPPLREDERTVLASAASVVELLDREVARGVPADRVVVMGFSQGGAMALHVGARYSSSLAGIAVLSGYLVLPDRLQEEWHPQNRTTPTLFCHGTLDPVVPFFLGQRAHQTVSAHNPRAEFHAFPMPHTLCLPEIEVLKDWLSRCLA